jgi:hypothetical protein
MVLFKHGVAYLERSGAADGPFELSFRLDEMNDVLKSLAVWVARGEATVGAVAFDKPEDPEDALARRKLRLEPGQALQGLLASLRGRRVSIATDDAPVEGEVVGIENVPVSEGAWRMRLLLRTGDGQLAMVDLDRAKALSLVEAPSRADLEFLVDRSRAATAGESRLVRVALDGSAEDLRVSYVIPAPIWRVSYRLATSGDGVLLMAWGIVHNPADEDLDGIDLTLTTGQPVSFVIDLYNPKNVARTVVEESSRTAAAPTQFERAPMAPPPAPRAAAPMAPPAMAAPMGAGFGPPPGMPMAPSPAPMAQAMAASAAPAADYADRGEFFEYRVATRVSIKRGGSAMVPLLSRRIPATKERIWRVGQPPSPDLVLEFDNDSGAVLEEGPAVIYADDVYAGEAMVPYSARKTKVRLGFAKDLAVRCKSTSRTQTVVTGLSLTTDTIVEESRFEQRWALRADSDHREPVDVVFEVPKQHGHSWDPEGPQPFESTANFHRFRVSVPPHGSATLEPIDRWPAARAVYFTHMNAADLQGWFDRRFLDAATYGALAEVFNHHNAAAQADVERQRVEREREEAWQKQAKISQQLGVLKEGGPEGELRMRYVRELSASQDVVNQCEQRAALLRNQAERERELGRQKLAALTRQK